MVLSEALRDRLAAKRAESVGVQKLKGIVSEYSVKTPPRVQPSPRKSTNGKGTTISLVLAEEYKMRAEVAEKAVAEQAGGLGTQEADLLRERAINAEHQVELLQVQLATCVTSEAPEAEV